MTGSTLPRFLFLTSPMMRGEDVLAVQQALSAAGFAVEQDGIFGLETSTATQLFQGRRSLAQDGIIGPATWAELRDLGSAVTAAGNNTTDAAKRCYDRLTDKGGWSGAQACGIVANLEHESNFNPCQFGDRGSAYGLAQWHPPRQRAFEARMGKPIQGSSIEDQLDFLTFEMREGTEQAAGKRLKAAGTARESGEVVCRFYERPADPIGQSRIRGNCAAGYFGRFTGTQPNAAEPVHPLLSSTAARAATDLLSADDIADLMRPHRLFQHSAKWLLSERGITLDGAAAPDDDAAAERIDAVIRAYRPTLTSVLGNGQVPIELVVAAISVAYDLQGKLQLWPGADRTNPERTPNCVTSGLMQTTLAAARVATGKPDLLLRDLDEPETAIRAGTGAMWLRALETRFDPPLVAAMHNVGELRYDLGNHRWGIWQYPVAGKPYVDEFIRYFNAAMKATAALRDVPSTVLSFHHLLEASYRGAEPAAAATTGVGPYVAESPLSWTLGPSVDDGQCVALVRRAASAPHTSLWRRGRQVQGDTTIASGTVIATFDPSGLYGNHIDGRSHAALYVGQDSDGILVVDQWAGESHHSPAERKLRFGRTDTKAANRGEDFYVVLSA